MKDKKQLVTVSGGLKLQDQLLAELDKSAQDMGQDFSDYGRKCVVNAIASLVIYTKEKGIELTEFDATLVRLALQNIGYTELNIAAIPSECYFDIRKTKDGKKTLAIKPQGIGNEKLLRTYGVNVKEVRSPWKVREGDDFTYPSYDGLNVTPPKWTPKSFDKKIIMVVYPVIKNDNTVEYLIATREGVKPNIVAQIRQNTMYEKNKDDIYARLEKDAENKTVDELLTIKEWVEYINPTYTSSGSREQMILRKMCNNALKNYPKDYKDSYMKNAVENMFEDNDDSIKERKDYIEADAVEKVEKEIAEQPSDEKVNDFNADDDGVVEDKEESVKEGDISPNQNPNQEPKVEDYGF